MEIKQKDDGKKGSFYFEENGKVLAEMAYVYAGTQKIIIDHTEVSPLLEGKGVGKLLLANVVEMARQKALKILPICPYAKHVMEKSDAYKDVLF